MTYLNDKAKVYVEPLAGELEAPILMPLGVRAPGQMEAVFERIGKDWGGLHFVVHSIAFSPKEALQGRVVDVERDGFLTTMEVMFHIHRFGSEQGLSRHVPSDIHPASGRAFLRSPKFKQERASYSCPVPS